MNDPVWFLAAATGDSDRIVAGLSRGADVDKQNESGDTALMLAVDGRWTETIGALIRAGADLDVKNNIGWTAMTWAVANAVGWILHVPGWKRRAPDTRPMEILAAAGASAGLREAVALSDVELAQRAMDKDTSIDVNANASFFAHPTFLTLAVQTGSLPMVGFLVERGADVNLRDDAENAALLVAAGSGNVSIVARLLDLGAEVNMGWPGETALSTAQREGHSEVVSLLLARGAKKRLVDAIETGDRSFAEALLRGGADPNGQHLQCGEPNAPGSEAGYRLVRDVMLAVATGSAEIVSLFLQSGAAQYLDYCDEHSLLVEAALHGRLEVVRLLLDRGADLRTVGRDGLTALRSAVEAGHPRIVDILRSAGASE